MVTKLICQIFKILISNYELISVINDLVVQSASSPSILYGSVIDMMFAYGRSKDGTQHLFIRFSQF